ncbi:MAG: hypothetical protein QG620_296 [Patescibacteria group bacterium]|nr:hypothetical protein [Patescibacteria group bacterium]
MGERIFGVGFLLFSKTANDSLKLFTVEELGSKPRYHKFQGMKSFPLETFEEKDGSFKETILRLLTEEVGIKKSEAKIINIAAPYFQLIPGRNDIYTVYGYGLYLGNSNETFVPNDVDIRFAGWKTIDELLQQYIRVEVAPILKHFTDNHLAELLNELSATA